MKRAPVETQALKNEGLALGIRYENLKTHVREYVDNLEAQMLDIVKKYGVSSVEEFVAKAYAHKIDPLKSEPDRQQIINLIGALMEAYRKDEIPASEGYDPWRPRELKAVIKKENYRAVNFINVGSVVHTLQALPDGTIVSGSGDKNIRIWSKDPEGEYQISQELTGHYGAIITLQVLPDGTIVSGSNDGTMRIWDGDEVNK